MYVTPVYRHWVPPLNGYDGWVTVGARLPCLGNVGTACCGFTVQDSHGGLAFEYTVYTTASNPVYHSRMVTAAVVPPKVAWYMADTCAIRRMVLVGLVAIQPYHTYG